MKEPEFKVGEEVIYLNNMGTSPYQTRIITSIIPLQERGSNHGYAYFSRKTRLQSNRIKKKNSQPALQ
jgi:hypothetical protein